MDKVSQVLSVEMRSWSGYFDRVESRNSTKHKLITGTDRFRLALSITCVVLVGS
jgi:hypothetical protein